MADGENEMDSPATKMMKENTRQYQGNAVLTEILEPNSIYLGLSSNMDTTLLDRCKRINVCLNFILIRLSVHRSLRPCPKTYIS